MNAADPNESTVALSAATRVEDQPSDSGDDAAAHVLAGNSSFGVADATAPDDVCEVRHPSAPANAAHTSNLIVLATHERVGVPITDNDGTNRNNCRRPFRCFVRVAGRR